MKFEYVLPELRNGKKVIRKTWLSLPMKPYLVMRISKLYLVYNDSHERESILFQIDDLLADDWELLPD